MRVVPQRRFNILPPDAAGGQTGWQPGDLVIHWAGSKGDSFVRAIEGHSLPDAAPPCKAGGEFAAWEAWYGEEGGKG